MGQNRLYSSDWGRASLDEGTSLSLLWNIEREVIRGQIIGENIG